MIQLSFEKPTQKGIRLSFEQPVKKGIHLSFESGQPPVTGLSAIGGLRLPAPEQAAVSTDVSRETLPEGVDIEQGIRTPAKRPYSPTYLTEEALGGIDRLFGKPETFEGLRTPSTIPRQIARAGVGALTYLPTAAERYLTSDKDAFTFAGEEATGLLGMLKRFPEQAMLLAGAEQPLNPLDKFLRDLSPESAEELKAGLLEAPEEPLFTPMILGGGIRGGRGLVRKLAPEPKPIAEQVAGQRFPKFRQPKAKPPIEPTGRTVELPSLEEPPAKLPSAKEAWEMTNAQVSSRKAEGVFPLSSKVEIKNGKPIYTYSTKIQFGGKEGTFEIESKSQPNATIQVERLHKKIVEQALAEGKPVPPEVLKDYPDLAKKSPSVEEPVTTKQAVQEIIEGKAESKIGTAEFKKKMLAEIDKLPTEKTVLLGNRQYGLKDVKPKEFGEPGYVTGAKNVPFGKEPYEALAKDVTIQIPGDGEFTLGRGANLTELKRQVLRLKEKEPDITKLSKRTPPGLSLEEGLAEGVVEFTPVKSAISKAKKIAPAVEPGTLGSPQKRTTGFPPIERQKGVPLEPANLEQSIKGSEIGRQQVADYFRKQFQIPIRTGKFRHRAAGIFKTRPEVIRLKEANDIDTISHELGHFVEKKVFGGIGDKSILKNAPMEVQKELFKLGRELYGNRIPRGGYRSEGVAEYMAYWLTTEKSAEVAPKFHKYFQEQVLAKDPQFAKKLQGGRDLVRQWRKQGAIARVYGNIDFTSSKLAQAAKTGKIKSLITDVGLRINTLMADDLAPLEFVEKKMRGVSKLDPKQIDPITSPTMIARSVAKAAQGKAREMVLHGTFDPALQKTGAGLREVLSPVSRDMKNFLSYSYAKRAQELWKRDINPGISREDANFVVSKLKSSVFEEGHKGITAFENRVMDYLVESGGLSKEAAQAIMDLNPSHIPLKRVTDKSAFVSTGGKRLADLSQPIKRIKGSGLAIKNPIESILENTTAIISFADKTRVARALIELAEKTEGGGRWIEKIPTPLQATRVSIESLKKQLKEAGVDLTEAKMDEVLTVYQNAGVYKGRDNIVSLWRNGEREFYELDKRLYGTLKAIDQFHLPPALDFLFGRPKRSIQLGATGLNLGFGLITNPLRDAFTFGLQTEFTRGTPDLIAKGFVNRLRPQSKMATLFRRSGADFSQFLGLDRKQLQKAITEVLASDTKSKALNIIRHPIEAMKDIVSLAEAAPRLAEFEAALKFGEQKFGKGSESAGIMAARAAAEVTVDFRRVGVYGKVLNEMIPFWNASKEGTFRFARFAKEHPVNAAVKGIAAITIPTVMLWQMNRDKTWYRESEPWLRYGFWSFEVGTNPDKTPKILRIPRPFEWGIVFAGAPEMTLDYWYAKEPSIVKDGLKYMIEQTLPIGPEEIPPTLKIPLEMYANYDFFRDRPIDPFFEVKYKVPEDRFSDYTLETMKFMGRTFGVSPRKLQFLLDASTGGLGEDIVRSAEQAIGLRPSPTSETAADIPVVGRLFARTPTEEQRLKRIEFYVKDEEQKINNLFEAGKEEEAEKRLEKLQLFLKNRGFGQQQRGAIRENR